MNLPNGYHAENKGLKITVKLTETDIVESIIDILGRVALDERIVKNIRDGRITKLKNKHRKEYTEKK